MTEDPLGPLTLLYAEDDREQRERTVPQLEPRLRRLLVARDGVEALHLFHAHHPDLVVAALSLPGINGQELAEEVKRAPHPPPFIALAGERDTPLLLRAVNSGIDRHLTKPFPPTLLLDTLVGLAQRLRERHHAEEREQRLAHINRLLATSHACKRAFLTADTEQEALDAICVQLVESGGYRMAWIGFADHTPDRRVRPVAQYGFETGYLEGARISWADNEWGRGPTGTAIRTGHTQVANDIHHDPAFAPWREPAERRGYAASAAFPLLVEGRPVGALNVYSAHPFAFLHEERDLLKELADSLAAMLHTSRLHAEREQALAQVERLNRRNALILEAAGEGIFGLDADGRVVFVNPTAARLTGWEPAEMIGHHHHQRVHSVRADGSRYPSDECPILQPLRDGSPRTEGNDHFQRRDGSHFPVTYVSTPIVEQGRVTGAVVVFRDVSMEEEMEQARRDSEARLRRLVESATDAFFIHDREGWIIDANPAAANGLGYRREELLNMSIFELEVGVPVALVHETLAATERGETPRVEGRHRRRDGTTFPVEVSLSLLVKEPEPLFLAVARDVTERKQTEERLAEQFQLQQSLIDTFPSPLAYKFADNRIHGCNRAFAEVFGVKRETLIGKRMADILPTDVAETLEAHDEGLLRRGGLRRDELRLPYGDGRLHDTLLIRSAFPNRNGDVAGVVGVALDITELKQAQRALEASEELFRTLAEHSLAGVFLYRDTLVYANPATERISGYSHDELLTMHPWDFVAGEEMREAVRVAAQQRLQGEQFTAPYYEIKFITRDGEERWVHLYSTTVEYHGRYAGLVNFVDVTQRKAAEEMLAALNETLERRVRDEVTANREKDQLMFQQARYAQMGEMLSMIAHQWRQPLNAVSAAAIDLSLKASLEGVENSEIGAFTGFIERQTRNMSETINDFMDFFKPEKNPEPFRPRLVVEEIRRLMGAQLDNRRIQLVNQVPQALRVEGYRKELEQVLLNLIANARDAYEGEPESERTIVVGADDGAEGIALWVEDHAGGIDPQHLPRIFDPYFTTKAPGVGTGIGLYMSRTIVERRFGGRLEVTSDERGSRFTLHLPWEQVTGDR